MTRKDYVAIARAISDQRNAYQPNWDPNLFRALNDVSRELANILQADNARFDRARFLAACGVQS